MLGHGDLAESSWVGTRQIYPNGPCGSRGALGRRPLGRWRRPGGA
ncbi:hypothetical protein HMPREF9005_2090 [Actinomyces sp. oral taxon 178 str. F0338]|nr:hypothetical protein HMPREF9005_2090 [Actinomyces sp. oral taxon 178 str. F0338]